MNKDKLKFLINVNAMRQFHNIKEEEREVAKKKAKETAKKKKP